jgi:hypothetical protein
MVGSSAISIEQLQEFQEAILEVGEQETSRFCEGGCHWLYCPRNIFRMICDQKYLAKHIIMEFCIFVLGSHLILQRNMSCFCLFVVLKSTDV